MPVSRHRTANMNEYRARHPILDRGFCVLSPEHSAAQSSSDRQGRGEVLASVRGTVAGEAVSPEGSGLSKRDWREAMGMLGRDG